MVSNANIDLHMIYESVGVLHKKMLSVVKIILII